MDAKPVRSVERAISILFLVAGSDGPLGLTEIGRATGLDKATALRLLQTLERSQLVKRDRRTRRYIVGSNVWRLPKLWRNDLRELSRPYLEDVQRSTEETVSLVCPRGLERVVIEVCSGRHELCVVPTMGATHPIYSGASGKVIMAFLPALERDQVIALSGLKRVAPDGAADRAAYIDLLNEVRRKGYASSTGDITAGVSALAAPVFDAEGAVVAVLAVRGPEVRMTAERTVEMAPLVVGAANEISWQLGHEFDRRETA